MNEYAFIRYLLTSAVAFSVLFSAYILLFRKDTFHERNRIYLLLSIILSLILPLPEVSVKQKAIVETQLTISTIEIYPGETLAAAETSLSVAEIILGMYFIIAALLILRLIYSCIRIICMIKNAKPELIDGRKVYLSKSKHVNFTFFGRIIVDANLIDSPDLHAIILHEREHARHMHSLDNLFMELFLAFQWFNPLVWLAWHKLKEIHEMAADRSALDSGININVYKELLLRHSSGLAPLFLTNNLNFALLKRRIIMMSKIKSPRTAWLKMLLLAPFAALVVFFISCTDKSGIETEGKVFTEYFVEDAKLHYFRHKGRVLKDGEPLNGNVEYKVEIFEEEKGGEPIWSESIKTDIRNGYYEIWLGKDHPLEIDLNKAKFFELSINDELINKRRKLDAGIQDNEAQLADNELHQRFYKSLVHFIQKNIKYPESARKEGREGKVQLKLIYDLNKKEVDADLIKGIHKDLDEEALRVVKSIPPELMEKGIAKNKDDKFYDRDRLEIAIPVKFRLK